MLFLETGKETLKGKTKNDELYFDFFLKMMFYQLLLTSCNTYLLDEGT